jgi:hypothetical protein
MDEYSFPRAKVRRHTVTFGSRQHGKLLGASELKFSIINVQGIEAIIVPTINKPSVRTRAVAV